MLLTKAEIELTNFSTSSIHVHFINAGSGMIWMDDTSCHGNENALTDCEFSGWGNHTCDHSEDAGVVCGGTYIHTYTYI